MYIFMNRENNKGCYKKYNHRDILTTRMPSKYSIGAFGIQTINLPSITEHFLASISLFFLQQPLYLLFYYFLTVK